MAKIFDVDFHKGQIVDTAGVSTVTNNGSSTLINTDKGLAISLNGTSQSISTVNANLSLATGSLEMSFKTMQEWTSGSTQLFSFSNGASTTALGGLSIGNTTGAAADESIQYALVDTSTILQIVVQKGHGYYYDCKWHHVIVVIDGVDNRIYIDGQLQVINIFNGTKTTARFTNCTGSNTFAVGQRYYPASPLYFKGNIGLWRIYNNSISNAEAYRLYNQWLSYQPEQPPKTNLVYPKPIQVRETGLLCAYNMKLRQGKVYDISGNNNDLTNYKAIPTKAGLGFSGTKYIRSTNSIAFSGTQQTICMRFKYTAITGTYQILAESSTDFNTNVGAIALSISPTGLLGYGLRLTAGGTYIFYTSTTTVKTGVWNNLVCTLDTTIVGATCMNLYINGELLTKSATSDSGVRGGTFSTQILYIGTRGGSSLFFGGEIEDIKIYTRVLSTAERNAYHNKFAKRIVFKEDFSFDKADSTNIVPRGWIRTFGTGKIVTNVTPVLSPGEKLSNGNFEAGSGTTFTGWGAANGGTSNLSEGVGEGYLGGRCPKLNVDSSNNYIQIYQGTGTVGKYYKCTFYAKATGGSWQIRFGAGNNVAFTPTTSYAQYTLYGTLTINTALYIQNVLATSQTLWIDDISLTEYDGVYRPLHLQNYFESTASSIFAHPLKWVYGTLEFDFYIPTSSSQVITIPIIAQKITYGNQQIGYELQLSYTGQTTLRYVTGSSNSAIMQSATSYTLPNTWYGLKLTRTKDGIFTLYLKGGSLGKKYVLMSTSGGSGTNPATNNTYTTSNYLVLVPNATGIRIGNIVMKDDIEA